MGAPLKGEAVSGWIFLCPECGNDARIVESRRREVRRTCAACGLKWSVKKITELAPPRNRPAWNLVMEQKDREEAERKAERARKAA